MPRVAIITNRENGTDKSRWTTCLPLTYANAGRCCSTLWRADLRTLPEDADICRKGLWRSSDLEHLLRQRWPWANDGRTPAIVAG